MSFQFSEKHINDFFMTGFTVFRSVLPPKLIHDMRRSCEKGAAISREKWGPTMRFQISDVDIDKRPFQDYAELPELREAVAKLVGPTCVYADSQWFGVFIEPMKVPWCTEWHRDARGLLTDAEWEHWTQIPSFGNQVNCALYEDSCTWYVPGSHLRGDTHGERRALKSQYLGFGELNAEGDFTSEERERICLEYCEAMPGATRLYLNAGDFAIYRPFGWHIGCYSPYKIRRTLLDSANDLDLQAGWKALLENARARKERELAAKNGKHEEPAEKEFAAVA